MDDLLEAQVGARLLARGWTIGAAESCTGGLVMHRLTNVPGSSAYIIGGVVAYANEVKQALLGVQTPTLAAHGAVSAEVALEMADGLRTLLRVDVAVSITGIAGPGGATPRKPVGLVYIGLVAPGGIQAVRRYVWPGNREAVKIASTDAALNLILEHLP
jgi:PncC family amidohydrolase